MISFQYKNTKYLKFWKAVESRIIKHSSLYLWTSFMKNIKKLLFINLCTLSPQTIKLM